MKEKFRPEFKMVDEPQITPMPSFIFMKIRDIFEGRNIEYKKYNEFDLPDGAPGLVNYHGVLYKDHLVWIECKIERENLLQVAEDLYHVAPGDYE